MLIDISDLAASSTPKESMPPGHNGPYRDPETPVRNTAHWLITLSRAYEWTGKGIFLELVDKFGMFLLSNRARPHGYAFNLRTKETKDRCNGLIGQAWTFEGLVEAGRLLGDCRHTCLAEEVFFQHHFDKKIGLWHRLEINGQLLPLDPTFNHQLWFAACASLIEGERSSEILRRVTRFLDCLEMNLSVLPNGLLYHPIERLLEEHLPGQFDLNTRTRKTVRNWLLVLKDVCLPEKVQREKIGRKTHEELIYKSIGYHAFNMFAFALLKQQIPNHPFWSSKVLEKMVTYMLTDEYRAGLEDNRYGYAYNPPGFEVPFSLYVLKDLAWNDLIEISKHWIGEQFRRCFNPKTKKMERNTEDPNTHTARIYELTSLPQEILGGIDIELP